MLPHGKETAGRMEQTFRSEIQKFYDGCKVFVTGGTGFMGKILIEKLLRSTGVATIYVLARDKRGKDVQSRLDEILEGTVFDRLRAEAGKFKHRVVAVKGDCTLPGLGLTIEDREMLIAKVDMVFHAAATVRFDENLKVAFRINVSATRDVLELAKQMKKLKAIVHVSTAYANCHLEKIEERFYDYPICYEEVERLLEKMDEKTAQEVTPRILDQWPNTYTFTKAMAESLIRDHCSGLPLGIFRPAIVVSTYSEPLPGWVDNVYGPMGVVAGAASGLLRTLHCDSDVVANIVPVDSCVAAFVASAWDISERNPRRTKEDVPIYNFVSSVENPITWGEFNTINLIYDAKYPLAKSIWCIRFRTTNNALVYNFQKFFYHCVPACFMDVVLICTGQKPRFLSMYKKIHKFSDVIRYFCTRDWDFTNTNVVLLWSKMSERDRQMFPFSIKTVLWLQYFKTFIRGLRIYHLKDPLSTLPASLTRRQRFKVAHGLLKMVLCFLLMYLVWSQLSNAVEWLERRERSLTFQHV